MIGPSYCIMCTCELKSSFSLLRSHSLQVDCLWHNSSFFFSFYDYRCWFYRFHHFFAAKAHTHTHLCSQSAELSIDRKYFKRIVCLWYVGNHCYTLNSFSSLFFFFLLFAPGESFFGRAYVEKFCLGFSVVTLEKFIILTASVIIYCLYTNSRRRNRWFQW